MRACLDPLKRCKLTIGVARRFAPCRKQIYALIGFTVSARSGYMIGVGISIAIDL